MGGRVILKETRCASTCESCGGSVTLKEWLIKNEQGKIVQTRFGFLYICESCGFGSEHEAEIQRKIEEFARTAY